MSGQSKQKLYTQFKYKQVVRGTKLVHATQVSKVGIGVTMKFTPRSNNCQCCNRKVHFSEKSTGVFWLKPLTKTQIANYPLDMFRNQKPIKSYISAQPRLKKFFNYSYANFFPKTFNVKKKLKKKRIKTKSAA